MPPRKEKEKTPLSLRLIWLRNSKGMSQNEVGVALGMASPRVYQKWELGYHPNRKNLDRIIEYYGCSRTWLITGEGDPFPGVTYEGPTRLIYASDSGVGRDAVKRLEIQSPDPHQYNPGQSVGSAPEAPIADALNIDEAMGKTYKVLSSNTPYAVALYLNIQQFASSLDMAQEMKVCKERLETMNDEIGNLRSQVGELRQQVDRLTAVPDTAAASDDSLEKKAG